MEQDVNDPVAPVPHAIDDLPVLDKKFSWFFNDNGYIATRDYSKVPDEELAHAQSKLLTKSNMFVY